MAEVGKKKKKVFHFVVFFEQETSLEKIEGVSVEANYENQFLGEDKNEKT